MSQLFNLTIGEAKFLNGGGEADCPFQNCHGRVRPVDSRCNQVSKEEYEVEVIYRCLKCHKVGKASYRIRF